MSKVVITGNASGTGDFTIAAPNSNTDRTLTLPDEVGTVLTTAGVPSSAMPSGSVIQILQSVKSDTFTTTSTNYVDIPNLSVTMTPSSTSSKIHVTYNCNANSFGHASIKLVRVIGGTTTDVAIGDASGIMTRCGHKVYGHSSYGTIYNIDSFSKQFLDSPNTTSAVTYKIQGGCPHSNTYTLTINRQFSEANFLWSARTHSEITLMEISG
jgi:hypothetical protein